MKPGTQTLYQLISILALLATMSKADVIIGDAVFYDDWQLGRTLITTNTTGGLSVDINETGGGNYEFTLGIIPRIFGFYSTSVGQEFTPVQAEGWATLVPGTSMQTFALNETKYYTYWQDVSPGGVEDEVDIDDNYGWVSLTYTGSGLEITDSATALGGGIIVGTYTQIPEPSSVLLLIAGAGGLIFYRRSTQRKKEQYISRRSYR